MEITYYNCALCSYKTKRKYDLKRHQNAKHNKENNITDNYNNTVPDTVNLINDTKNEVVNYTNNVSNSKKNCK